MSSSCRGATKTSWICEPNNTSAVCGAFRYSVPELLNLQSSLVQAAQVQKPVVLSWTTCTGGATEDCLYTVAFRP